MADLLVLVHTVPPLIEVFNRLAAELLPGVRLLHVLDEPLLEQVRRRGHLADEDALRLGTHVQEAARIGAAAVLITCSTVSPCVDAVRDQAEVPVLRIDEVMIREAVVQGSYIGVIATNRTTLEPTRQLLQAEGARTGRQIDVELLLVEGALPALLNGDGAAHDRLVRQAILSLAPRVDVVVLAQASIARVMSVLAQDPLGIQVLSSPHLALQQVARLLRK
ncbi:MAG: aspartate/glutamate racemase family protein [Caldilineaceae bacterium]